ncbi:uncharacterized protein LOC112349967 [Selaginella moellendorffii]|uniref:uncharacterized protein LOC112349967 n=1 Tax=Selaginella moellendorffii TaxID=88036 RepID=UPI000D1D03D9|nr:uncharacterized protein LOC112349967 [Selaginella moellendorffii]|eukprot:XP_024541061.1 uncharacterized protein LOC112349967 [Selaginella moellendorffii]
MSDLWLFLSNGSLRQCPGCLFLGRKASLSSGLLVSGKRSAQLCWKRRLSQRIRATSLFELNENDSKGGGGNFLKLAGVIGSATALSKVLGLVRELVLAAVFGVGPVVDAFGYASIVPGFFLTILGGINGPIHIAMVSALSKISEEDRKREVIGRTSHAMFVISLSLGILMYTLAAFLIDAIAPGLLLKTSGGLITRSMAILQLRIMAPCVTLACLMGIGYGSLSASGRYGIASLSPALSSISIILAAAIHCKLCDPLNLMNGGVLLALASTVGALAQWLLQIFAQDDRGRVVLRWENPFADKDVKEVLLLMMPATISSGMLQLATYTDLYFASYFPNAAAALGYANLLVMAPLGIISSAVLLPLVPVFSKLSQPSNWPELRAKIHQGITLCMALTLPMTALAIPLAKPIVRALFQRYAFDDSAAQAVSSLVKHYALGSTFYLLRDLLVRVFYGLGDGQAPFYVSLAAIFANALLDWVLVAKLNLGPSGLIMATSIVNLLSTAALWQILSRRIQ